MQRPSTHEYPQNPYFSRYIEKVDNEPITEVLNTQMKYILNLYENLSESQLLFRYAEGKWSLKELLGHLTDSERIFSYRALCIARGEKQALPGFDENEYMEAANFDQESVASLVRQYQCCRQSTLALLEGLNDHMLSQMGNANGNAVSARALIWMIAGHEKHHLDIIAERYLPLL